ncbi:MAG: YggT family protein [Rhodospirillaceae bacterium]
MNTILIPLLQVLIVALDIYKWIVIISVILTWLVAFNVINPHNQFIRMVGGALHQMVEPILRRIRRVVPVFGSVDISPIILFLLILFIQLVLGRIIGALASAGV